VCMCVCVCVCVLVCARALTQQPDDIESGVGEDGRVALVETVVRLLVAPHGLPGRTVEWGAGMEGCVCVCVCVWAGGAEGHKARLRTA